MATAKNAGPKPKKGVRSKKSVVHKPWKEGDTTMLLNQELVLTGQLRDFGKKLTQAILRGDSKMSFKKLNRMSNKQLFAYIQNLPRI